jgi:hypothetical protein
MKRFWVILAAFLGLAAAAVPASANVQWSLNDGSGANPGNSGAPYGTVKAVQMGTGTGSYVEVTIKLNAGNYFMASGSHDGITWDMSVVPGAITVLTQNPPPPGTVHSDASQFDVQALNGSYGDPPFTSGAGLSDFNYDIKPKAGSGGAGTEQSIVFDITKAGTGIFLSNVIGQANTLFTKNGVAGYYWAMDIGFNCTGTPGTLSCASTGTVAAGNDPTDIPEPGTWTLSIAGLAGLTGLVVLRRRRKLARA